MSLWKDSLPERLTKTIMTTTVRTDLLSQIMKSKVSHPKGKVMKTATMQMLLKTSTTTKLRRMMTSAIMLLKSM